MSLLKPFGCLYFASSFKVHRSKFQPRASPCVFLEYSDTQKVYKVLNLQSEVIFALHFPYHLIKSDDTSLYSSTIILPKFTSGNDDFDFNFMSYNIIQNPHNVDYYAAAEHSELDSKFTVSDSTHETTSDSHNNSNFSHVVDVSVPLRSSHRTKITLSYLSDYPCFGSK